MKLLILLLLSLVVLPVCAEDIGGKLKVAYIANILKFFYCPEKTQQTITLCVDEKSPISGQLQRLSQLDVYDDKALQVYTSLNSPSQCDVVYWDEQTIEQRSAANGFDNAIEISGSVEHSVDMEVVLFIEDNHLKLYLDKNLNSNNVCKLSSALMRISADELPR